MKLNFCIKQFAIYIILDCDHWGDIKVTINVEQRERERSRDDEAEMERITKELQQSHSTRKRRANEMDENR